MDELIKKVEQWATNKGLDKSAPEKQFLKVAEETAEIARGLARGDIEEVEDGIGDTIVTVIILAMQLNLKIDDCLMTAYNEIRDRKGKLIDGVFVKEADYT